MEAPRLRPRQPLKIILTARHKSSSARLPAALLGRANLVADLRSKVEGLSAEWCDKIERKNSVIELWHRVVTFAP